jgi:hypothetical protein
VAVNNIPFLVSLESFGEVKEVELIKGGKDIMV